MYSTVDLSVFSKFASGGIVRGGELKYPTSCKWHVITKYDICDSQALILVEYSENFSARADAPIGNSLSIAFERVWGRGSYSECNHFHSRKSYHVQYGECFFSVNLHLDVAHKFAALFRR